MCGSRCKLGMRVEFTWQYVLKCEAPFFHTNWQGGGGSYVNPNICFVVRDYYIKSNLIFNIISDLNSLLCLEYLLSLLVFGYNPSVKLRLVESLTIQQVFWVTDASKHSFFDFHVGPVFCQLWKKQIVVLLIWSSCVPARPLMTMLTFFPASLSNNPDLIEKFLLANHNST